MNKKRVLLNYNELKGTEKERVKNLLLGNISIEKCFKEIRQKLKTKFPNSSLVVNASISKEKKETDYLNISGNLYLFDLLQAIKENFSNKEKNYLEIWVKTFYPIHKTYRFKKQDYDIFLVENITVEFNDTDLAVIKKFNSLANKYMKNMVFSYMKEVHDYYFVYADERAEEIAQKFGYKFDEHGKIIPKDSLQNFLLNIIKFNKNENIEDILEFLRNQNMYAETMEFFLDQYIDTLDRGLLIEIGKKNPKLAIQKNYIVSINDGESYFSFNNVQELIKVFEQEVMI